MDEPLTRDWHHDHPLDLLQVLSPLRRGNGDPTTRVEQGELWWASTTAHGPATLRLRRVRPGTVRASAWGPGADAVLAGVPDLLGASDDDSDFRSAHDVVTRGMRNASGMRLCASGRVWDVLVAAVLEQKVTNREAWRSWRELCRRFGHPAPGPVEKLWTVPDPHQVRRIRDWEWHRAGIDGARRRTLLAAASSARSLEKAVALRGEAGRDLLQKIPGIGPWTAAEVAQRAWGDPDAVSVGDFHLPTIVGTALVGHPLDDEGMLDVLSPYEGHRHRAVRYLVAAGVRRPRYAPRLPVRDFRAI
ncbi:DNA-3-methyladenine glycosylase 2 family protein [Saccharopolyspora rhizosphaerae]|uniref:DNA-3-methyladenine glycosylase II n=1 Tax=Saccharopolyspora rhizosphaerae TaxID=2492662 RepID=A0A426JHV7_9PSEU|nr:DNA-3-methyladenine glycosylase 2 family protein [Saccharopolyspora rhizosphaerae]RRO12742.1 DNA-3-methyladenine glycosylase 2 family protein [Saccharopolyspora rhizosphaerae]